MPGPGKVVQGPDGKVIQFPDSMDDAAINQAMSGMYGGGQQKQQQMSMPAKPPQPGFFTRAAQAVGLPSSREELEAAQPSMLESLPIIGPAMTVGKAAVNYAQRLPGALQQGVQETKEAIQNVQAGQPMLPNIGKAAYGQYKALSQVAAPIGGEAVWNVGEDVARKNYAGAAGGATGVTALALLGALGGKKTPSASMETRVNKFARAIEPASGTVTPETITKAVPDIDAALAKSGTKVNTVRDVQQAVHDADRAINTEYNTKLQPLRAAQFDTTSLADQVRTKMAEFDPKLAAERKIYDTLNRTAKELDGLHSGGWLDQRRINANNRNMAFEKASAMGQTADLQTQGRIIADKIIADGARDILYDAMDKFHNQNLAPGATPYDFRDLKLRQGALYQIANQMGQEIPKLDIATAVKRGSSLIEKGHVHTYVNPQSAHGGMTLSNVASMFTTPMGGANAAARAAFPQAGTSTMGTMAAASAATAPLRELAIRYPTAQSIMLGMKSGDLTPQQGAQMLQKMRKSASAGPTRRLPQPETPPQVPQ